MDARYSPCDTPDTAAPSVSETAHSWATSQTLNTQRRPDAERDPRGRPLDETVVLIRPDLDLRRAPATPASPVPNAPSPPLASRPRRCTRASRQVDRRLTNLASRLEGADGHMTLANRPEAVVPESRTPWSFCRLGRTVIYEQIRSGRLRSVTQGRTRLIPASAIGDYIALLEREAETEGAA